MKKSRLMKLIATIIVLAGLILVLVFKSTCNTGNIGWSLVVFLAGLVFLIWSIIKSNHSHS